MDDKGFQDPADAAQRESTLSHASDGDLEKQSIQSNHEATSDANASAAKPENVVDWDGPDDPANPLNWTFRKKAMSIFVVSMLCMLSYVCESVWHQDN